MCRCAKVLIFFTDLLIFYFMGINICTHLCVRPTREPGAGRSQRKMSECHSSHVQTSGLGMYFTCRALAQHAGVLFPIPSTVGMGEATRLTCNLVIVLFSLRQGRALGSKLGKRGFVRTLLGQLVHMASSASPSAPRAVRADQAFLPTSGIVRVK